MKNTLSDALRNAFTQVLKDECLDISDISNYNIGRAANTGIFTFILYKNIKTKKGDKKSVKLKIDNSTSTLVTALDVLDSMIQENAKSSFLSGINETKQEVQKTW